MKKHGWTMGILLPMISALLLFSAFAQESVVLGQSSAVISSLTTPDYTLPTVCESELGRLAADAMRSITGSDLAILGGGELTGGLPKGDVTEADIRRVLPANREVLILEADTALLQQAMEYALGFGRLGQDERIDPKSSAFEGFPQISGFEVEYDISQMPGQRVRSLRLADGTVLKPGDGQVVTLAVSEAILESGYDMLGELPARSSGSGTADLLATYTARVVRLNPPGKMRVHAVGTASNTLIKDMGILPFLPVALILVLLVMLPRNRKQLRNLDGSRSKRYRDYGNGNYDL